MGQWLVNEGVETWSVCATCGASEGQIKAERDLGVQGECWHGSITDVCDDENCEACNNDPDLWALGLRDKPLSAWDDEDEDALAEQAFEELSAFGEGVNIVNVLTGERWVSGKRPRPTK